MHNQDSASSTRPTDCGNAVGDVQVSPRITGITSPLTRKGTPTSESTDVPSVPPPPIATAAVARVPPRRSAASFRLTTRRPTMSVPDILRVWLGGTALIALAACREPAAPTAASPAMNASAAHAEGGALAEGLRSAIDSVRNATARFQNLAEAQAAGYTSQYPAGCAASPAGAQGFHYLNPALVDTTVELLEPELVRTPFTLHITQEIRRCLGSSLNETFPASVTSRPNN